MIYKWSWGIALVLIGLSFVGLDYKFSMFIAGVALVVAGIASITGK